MSGENWFNYTGGAVVAERDQFEAGMRDLVADSRMLFCFAMVEGDGEPKVRALFHPDGGDRDLQIVAFLALAEVEVRRMLVDAGEML